MNQTIQVPPMEGVGCLKNDKRGVIRNSMATVLAFRQATVFAFIITRSTGAQLMN